MDFEANLHTPNYVWAKCNFNENFTAVSDEIFQINSTDDPQAFLENKSTDKFINFLYDILNEPGKRSNHAKDLYSFLKRKQNNFLNSKANSCSFPKHVENTHTLSTHEPKANHETNKISEPPSTHPIEHETGQLTQAMKRSASVDLFLNTEKTQNGVRTPNQRNDHTCLATAPIVSTRQPSTQPNYPLRNYTPTHTHPIHKKYFNQTIIGHQPVMIRTETADECSWKSPPSTHPCFLQYRLAIQYNRSLQLPGVIGPDSECVDDDIQGVKADMKRFFETIYKGRRYTAISDYLRHYPQCILDLLQGPFGHTAFEHAVHLRCFNHANVANYSTYTHANEVIIPPPDMKKSLKLWIGTYGIPRDDKRHRGGEDVWFASNSLNAMGIADGVSEWMDLVGINPREFAEDLLKGALYELHQMKDAKSLDSSPGQSPSKLAYQALSKAFNKATHYGSSTAIIGLLNPRSSQLGIANLGDSGCLVLRRSSACGQLGIVTRVKEMQHGFNIPYQFTHLPAPSEWESLKFQDMGRIVGFAQAEYRRANELGKTIGDSPDDIQFFDMPVCDGDLIIIGSDGLFDNLFDYEITALTALALSPREAQLLYHDVRLATSPKNISKSLALAAYWKSLDPNAKTPFSKYSRQASGLVDFNGGKEDDISLAVAWVTAS